MDASPSSSSSASKDSSTPLSPSPSSIIAFQLLELPHDCLVRILSALSAPDVSRVARVCRTLRAIADSDDIWALRLPPDPAINPPFLSRKDLYFRLRAQLLRKPLSQPYWLDPETDEGCLVKSARNINITWGGDHQYWRWEPQPDSWFSESAVLYSVCWFEAAGQVANMFLPGAYTVSFCVKFMATLSGWQGVPVRLFLSTSHGQSLESRCFFDGRWNSTAQNIAPHLRSSRAQNIAPPLRSSSSSSWLELDVGEFVVHQEMPVVVNFGMLEIERGNWKSGVVLDCVKIQLSSAIRRI